MGAYFLAHPAALYIVEDLIDTIVVCTVGLFNELAEMLFL